GHALLDNAPHLEGPAMWLRFPKVNNERWHHGNVVLLGDAAATAHFSIGSGTKLALESAMALADKLTAPADAPLCEVLDAYEQERRVEVLKLQNAARNSTEWFESVALRAPLDPQQFAYSLLTRSQRVSHENLRLRDKEWLDGYERWFAQCAAGRPVQEAVPPIFTPYKLRDMELSNRVVVSPMCMYSAKDGLVNDFHLVHYGSRAQGGAGLLFTEMTDVSAEGRITPGCAGLYNDEHVSAWKRIVDYVHGHSDAKFAIQLGHAGPKASTKLGWEGYDVPLDEG